MENFLDKLKAKFLLNKLVETDKVDDTRGHVKGTEFCFLFFIKFNFSNIRFPHPFILDLKI